MGFGTDIGKFAAKIANKVDTSKAFVGSVQRGIQDEATSKIIKKSGDILFDEEVQGIQRKTAQAIYNEAGKIGGATSGAIMTGTAGVGAGAVIGGVSGAIEDDESALSGALKGAAIGGTVGIVGGGISGYAHGNGNVLTNISKDYKAVSKKIAEWGTRDGNGIVANNLRTTGTTYSM